MDLELVRIFVGVVKSGSFSRAGEALKLPKSTVSKAVARLERESGAKLLVRTTRSQTLTAAGKAFYDGCVGPIQAIEDARRSLSGSDSLLVGNLKLTAPEDIGTEIIAAAAGMLARKHPGLSFELMYMDEILDLVKDGYDLAVRLGQLKESGLKVKRIGEVRMSLVASPQYLKSQPKISKPEDLRAHACLSGRAVPNRWTLKSAGGTVNLAIRPRIVSNQMSSLLQAAISGAGVALVPAFLARAAIASGKAARVLPQWSSIGYPVSLVSPLPFSSSARLRVTTDHFTAELQRALKEE